MKNYNIKFIKNIELYLLENLFLFGIKSSKWEKVNYMILNKIKYLWSIILKVIKNKYYINVLLLKFETI